MKKSIFYLIGFFLLPLLMQAQTSVKEEVRRFVVQAQAAYNAEEYQDALELYQNALKLAPNFPDLSSSFFYLLADFNNPSFLLLSE